jgi:hypothetical protein
MSFDMNEKPPVVALPAQVGFLIVALVKLERSSLISGHA